MGRCGGLMQTVDVTVRYWAAAKDAAKMPSEVIKASNLAEVIDAVQSARPGDSRFAAVISRSSFLVNDEPAGKRDPASISLPDGATIEVLPAFAGG
jgi:molybdopterin synthase sulfur carrier subunit